MDKKRLDELRLRADAVMPGESRFKSLKDARWAVDVCALIDEIERLQAELDVWELWYWKAKRRKGTLSSALRNLQAIKEEYERERQGG